MSKKLNAAPALAVAAPIIVKDDKGDYIAELAHIAHDGARGNRAVEEYMRAQMVDGKLAPAIQAACMNSILLGTVADGLVRLPGWATKSYADRFAEALRLRRLTGWTKNLKNVTDDHRNAGQEALFSTGRSQQRYYRNKLGLQSLNPQGGARPNAGAKGAADKAATPEAPKSEAPKSGELLKGAANVTAESFTLVAPVKTVKDFDHYMHMLAEGLKRTMAKNPAAISDELSKDVCERILAQFARLDNRKG